MAWKNADVTIFGFPQSMVTDFSWCDNPQQNVNKVSVNAILPQNAGIIENSYVWGNNTGLALYCINNGNYFQLLGYNNGALYSTMDIMSSDLRDTETYVGYSYICCIDDETQKGILVFIWENLNTNMWGWNHAPVTGGNNYQYQLITANLNINYQWSSVPAISGKNGILSLTTLKEESINGGSPVDDATASAFNNAPNSCSVGGIVSVDLPIIDDNPLTIALKYDIPELTDSVYTSCKVVAKKNKIPKSKTDGDKILDVSPSSHGCVIKGLEQETKYYVVVFVEDSYGNKAESEPGGPVRTGKQDGIFKMRITTMQGAKDCDFKENIEITRV